MMICLIFFVLLVVSSAVLVCLLCARVMFPNVAWQTVRDRCSIVALAPSFAKRFGAKFWSQPVAGCHIIALAKVTALTWRGKKRCDNFLARCSKVNANFNSETLLHGNCFFMLAESNRLSRGCPHCPSPGLKILMHSHLPILQSTVPFQQACVIFFIFEIRTVQFQTNGRSFRKYQFWPWHVGKSFNRFGIHHDVMLICPPYSLGKKCFFSPRFYSIVVPVLVLDIQNLCWKEDGWYVALFDTTLEIKQLPTRNGSLPASGSQKHQSTGLCSFSVNSCPKQGPLGFVCEICLNSWLCSPEVLILGCLYPWVLSP